MAEIVNRVRSDFKILTRSLLTGIPEVEEFMIPVPFPHEKNARELGLQMRVDTIAHLKNGGVIIVFPAGKVAMSEGWWGPAVEGYFAWQSGQTGKSQQELIAEVTRNIPLGLIPDDGECARAAVFLASDYASVVTGAALDVNGGEYMPV